MTVLPVGFHEPSGQSLCGWSERTVPLQSITTIDLPLSQALKPQQLNDQWSKTVQRGASHGSSKESPNGYMQPCHPANYSSGALFLMRSHSSLQLVHKEFDNLLHQDKGEQFRQTHKQK